MQNIQTFGKRGEQSPAVAQALPGFAQNTLLVFLAFIYSGAFFLLVSVSPYLLYGFYLVLAGVTLICLSAFKLSRRNLKSVAPYFLWIFFYSLWGTLASPFVGVVLPEVIRMLFRTILIMGAVAIVLSKISDVRKLARFVQVAAILNFAVSLWETADPDFIRQIADILKYDFARFANYRPAGLWIDPNEAAFAFVFALLLSRWCNNGLLAWAGRLAALGGIYLTVSRSGTYLLALCLLVLVAYKLKSIRLNLRNLVIIINGLALVVLLGATLYLTGFIKVEFDAFDQWNVARLLDFSESSSRDNAQYTRGDVLGESIGLALDGEWYGYGIFAFQGNSNLGSDSITALANRLGVGAHNIYVAVLGELGFVGLLGYVAVLGLGFVRMLRTKMAATDRVTLGLIWICYLFIGIALHLQFTSVSFMIYTALLYHLPGVVAAPASLAGKNDVSNTNLALYNYDWRDSKPLLKVPALRLPEFRLKSFAGGSTNRRIFSAALTMAVLTLGVKLFSIVKDVASSATFGTGDAMDAFLIAYLLPSFVIGILVTPFSAALIPNYVQVRQSQGQAAAQNLFSKAVTLSTGLLLLVIVPLALLSPWLLPLLGSGFSPAKLALTQELFYLLLPVIILNGLTGIWSAILNAEERFTLSALVPALVPLVSVIFLFAFHGWWGIFALAFGTVAGFLLQAVLLGWGIKKSGLSLRPRWPGHDPAMRQIIREYLPIIAGSILLSSTGLIDQAIGAVLAPGSVSALSYGSKIVALITGITTVAIATAVLPYFSRMVAAANWSGILHTLKTYTNLIILATLPTTALLFFFSYSLVQIFYQRGAFTANDSAIVAQVQAMYVLQIPFYTLAMLYSRLISALRANHFLMWGTAISCILNVLLDLVLIRPLGIAGIALSTTLVYVVSFVFLFLTSHRLLKQLL